MPPESSGTYIAPDFSLEDSHSGIVAGVDEAGRGPLAGPVVAGAVILHTRSGLPMGINDSKKLTAKARDALFAWITANAHVGVGIATVEEIDHHNILRASLIAMQRAAAALPLQPSLILVDGNQSPDFGTIPHTLVIGGDALSLSIAAGSIIAKVTRDRIMQQLSAEFPYYGWERNAGYGTPEHQGALRQHGITIHHRKSFGIVREITNNSALTGNLPVAPVDEAA